MDNLADWEPPQVLLDHLPHGLSGFDKDGAPGEYLMIVSIRRVSTLQFVDDM